MRPSETGDFITNSQTGDFYPAANPSGFITGVDLSPYVTGDVVRPLDLLNLDIIRFNTGYSPSGSEPIGSMYWNNTEKTIDLIHDGAIQQMGQELHIPVRNNMGYTILNGTPVYFNGRLGNRPTICPAISDSHSTSIVRGITTEDIPHGEDGFITSFGYVRQIKTNYSGSGDWGTTWNENDNLYVSKTVSGQLTNVEPSAPHHSDVVSQVGIVGAHGIGSIFVDIKHHFTLSEASDINGTPLTTDGQMPTWNNASGVFDFDKNINNYLPLTGGILSGSITAPSLSHNGSEIGTNLNGNTEVLLNGAKSLLSRFWTYIKSVIDLGQTWAGNHTFTGQLEASAQAATTANSLMTRLLGDRRYYGQHLFTYYLPTNSGWSATTSGGGQNLSQSPPMLRLTTATPSLFGSQTVHCELSFIPSIGNMSGGGYGGIDFSRRIELQFGLMQVFNYDITKQSWAAVISSADQSAGVTAMTPVSGASYIAVVSSGGNITLQVCNGTTKSTSATLTTDGNGFAQAKTIRLVNLGNGTVELYTNNTLRGSLSGGPTGQVSTSSRKLYFCASSNATSSVGDAIIGISSPVLSWL